MSVAGATGPRRMGQNSRLGMRLIKKNMKILVLGGSGFVGGHLARRLSRDGHDLTIGTRYAPGCRHLNVVPRTRVRQFDPHDMDQLARAAAGHDAVINLVGILNERGFAGAGFRKAHVELVEKTIAVCRETGIRRLIHMSALNAGKGESHYLKTRGEAENLVGEAGTEGNLAWTIFRPSTIFGPDDSFLNRFATLLRISPVLPLARPKAKFAPVFVGDVAEAFARVLPSSESAGMTYELCGAEQWELKALVKWLAAQLRMRRLVIGLPDWAGRLQARFFDFVPGKPFSTDNFKSLLTDSVCADDGFARLGIEPWAMSKLAPTWLKPRGRQERYREYRRRARRGP